MTPQQLIELTARPHRILRKFGYDLPNGLLLAWLSAGPGVQLEFDLETDEGADDWTFWWLNGGRKNFEGISEQVDRVLLRTLHLDHLPGAEVDRVASLTPLLVLISRHRPDLVSEFRGSPRKLWRWWFAAGRTEYFGRLDWLIEAEVRLLHQLDAHEFVQSGIAPPTLLVRTLSEASSKARGERLNSAQVADAWQEFFSNDQVMWKLPNKGRPYIASGFPDRLSGTELTFGGIFPEEFALIYTQRLDLQQTYDSRTAEGLTGLVLWWLNSGRLDYAELRQNVDDKLLRSLHLQYLRPQDGNVAQELTPLLEILRAHRADLTDVSSSAQIWHWWFGGGRSEYFGTVDWLVEAELKALHQLDARSFERTGIVPPTSLLRILSGGAEEPQSGAVRISAAWHEFFLNDAVIWKLPNKGKPYITSGFPDRISGTELTFGGIFPEEFALIYTQRLDLQQTYDSRTAEGLTGLVLWWLNSGRLDYAELRQTVDYKLLHSLHLQYLHPQDDHAAQELTPLLKMLWNQRSDLQGAFDIATPDGAAQMWQWWSAYGEQEYFDRTDLLIEAEPRDEPVLPAAPADARAVSSHSDHPSVGLVGYPKGEFGLGEDMRLLRAALDRAKVKNFVIDAPWEISARQSINEPAIEASIASFDSDVMFYVMPPFDTVTLLNKVGPRAFSAQRKIGFWQWELDKFPDQAKLALNLVDEIWCHSEHSARAFRAATGKPVIKVPLPVSVPTPDLKPRASFNLPENAFVVFTSFDGASAIARKNPLASILAFEEAFRNGRGDARLVVKAMNTQNDSLWRECLRRAAVDVRIMIIDDVMDRAAYYELLSNCDAVLSLHRAEGFGRLMAEAMALEIPVIATRYSGNLDFMTDDNSWLIDGDLVPLFPGDYAFHQHQHWFEPSATQAACALRECAENRDDRQRRAALGKREILTRYSPDVCGQTYRKLIYDGLSSQPSKA